jgi:hypothetical protein
MSSIFISFKYCLQGWPGHPLAQRQRAGRPWYSQQTRQPNAPKRFRKAADQGLARAQYNLGVMCDDGNGTPKDSAEAVKWFRKAAELGNPNAQNNLGAMLQEGRSVPKDYVQAPKWYNFAAARGNESANDRSLKLAAEMTPEQIAQAQ